MVRSSSEVQIFAKLHPLLLAFLVRTVPTRHYGILVQRYPLRYMIHPIRRPGALESCQKTSLVKRRSRIYEHGPLHATPMPNHARPAVLRRNNSTKNPHIATHALAVANSNFNRTHYRYPAITSLRKLSLPADQCTRHG